MELLTYLLTLSVSQSCSISFSHSDRQLAFTFITQKFGYILMCPTRTQVVADSNSGCGLATKSDSFAVFLQVLKEKVRSLSYIKTCAHLFTNHTIYCLSYRILLEATGHV
jgi:hypothetical protein